MPARLAVGLGLEGALPPQLVLHSSQGRIRPAKHLTLIAPRGGSPASLGLSITKDLGIERSEDSITNSQKWCVDLVAAVLPAPLTLSRSHLPVV
jgi:hypothetical protein